MLEGVPRSQFIWILTILFIIFVIVLVGGITRLTGSGLSMVQWKPIMGIIPPLSAADWEHTFAQYQSFPEFQTLTSHFNLSDFKRIFFWEYVHRMLGRFLGILIVVPLGYFFFKKTLSTYLLKRMIVVTF